MTLFSNITQVQARDMSKIVYEKDLDVHNSMENPEQ